jgi:molybdate transport repressor ModE-like protein
MDWEDLRVFLAVAASGSLAGGARRLGVSQATAWRRIRALEDALGVTLFERQPGGYVLTAAGSALLKGVDGVQRTIEIASGRLTNEPEAVEGEVRVAAPEFAGLMIAERLPELARRHPGLVVELLTGSPAASLLVRDVDIALRAERMLAGGFALEGAFSIPFGLYASPGYLKRYGSPRAINDLKGHRLIGFDHSMAHVAPKPWLRSGGRGATIVFRSNSPHARLLATRAGLGLAMLPEPLARASPGIRLALSSDMVGELDLMLFVSGELRREARVIAARDFLAGLFKDYARPTAPAARGSA